jgi:hypothetical protein
VRERDQEMLFVVEYQKVPTLLRSMHVVRFVVLYSTLLFGYITFKLSMIVYSMRYNTNTKHRLYSPLSVVITL